jgi:hypothetical protein
MRRHLNLLLPAAILGCARQAANEAQPPPPTPNPLRCSDTDPFYAHGCPQAASDAPSGFLLVDDGQHVLRADFDGCGTRPVTRCPSVHSFSVLPLMISSDGEWLAYQLYKYSYAPAQMVVARTDGSQTSTISGRGIGDAGFEAWFVAEPPALLFASGDLFDEALWIAPLASAQAHPIGGPGTRALSISVGGLELIYSSTERLGTPGEQTVFWWTDLSTGVRKDLPPLKYGAGIWDAAFTPDRRWSVRTWACPKACATEHDGWNAFDATSGIGLEGSLAFHANLLAADVGSDVVLIGTSTIARLALPEGRVEPIYQAQSHHTVARPLAIPGSRRILFTELSGPDGDPLRGDLIELDLDSGVHRALTATTGLHIAELISPDGRVIVEGVFRTPCPHSFQIPVPRLGGRVATLLRHLDSGETRSLSTEAAVNPLGFSSDGRAVILGRPESTQNDPQTSRQYAIEAHPVDGAPAILVAPYLTGMDDGVEIWGILLFPSPRGHVTYPSELAFVCP